MTTKTSIGIRLKMMLIAQGAALWVPLQALAAGSNSSWRSTYDVVMLWVNFVILVALLLKFLRPHLNRFLKSQQEAIKKTLDQLESEKSRLRDDVEALRQSLAARKQRTEEWHQRTMQRARTERLEIIDAARLEAERRLAKARQLIDARHREACQALQAEIVDAAIAKVMEDLPGQITVELEQDLTDRFLSAITKPAS